MNGALDFTQFPQISAIEGVQYSCRRGFGRGGYGWTVPDYEWPADPEHRGKQSAVCQGPTEDRLESDKTQGVVVDVAGYLGTVQIQRRHG